MDLWQLMTGEVALLDYWPKAHLQCCAIGLKMKQAWGQEGEVVEELHYSKVDIHKK